MDARNVVQVQIFGHSYTIRGEADQEYILGVAAYVDRKMREITEKLPVASLSKVAILASLNIADELYKERAQREAQQKALGTRAARLNAVLDDLLEGSPSK
ncbi:MAG TPA: cell division protein ZapA [Candidatus Eisenbacteria bacterium]|jgi:cell division protein ZapA|nr:cell division protein ZapA [Candidatus Eisenbacteria bacterium]